MDASGGLIKSIIQFFKKPEEVNFAILIWIIIQCVALGYIWGDLHARHTNRGKIEENSRGYQEIIDGYKKTLNKCIEAL